jgi:hypothetical protein
MDENTFDIFEFLKMSHREDVLHTPMIAGLLNPLGLHGLGDLFLRRFLDCLSCPELSLTRADPSDYDWVVKREHLVPGGRIDILLLCPKKRIAIAIENKIRARESRTQLPCYLTWLRSLSPYYTTIGLCAAPSHISREAPGADRMPALPIQSTRRPARRFLLALLAVA